jgi:small-conductance mechanosensitive channel
MNIDEYTEHHHKTITNTDIFIIVVWILLLVLGVLFMVLCPELYETFMPDKIILRVILWGGYFTVSAVISWLFYELINKIRKIFFMKN